MDPELPQRVTGHQLPCPIWSTLSQLARAGGLLCHNGADSVCHSPQQQMAGPALIHAEGDTATHCGGHYCRPSEGWDYTRELR